MCQKWHNCCPIPSMTIEHHIRTKQTVHKGVPFNTFVKYAAALNMRPTYSDFLTLTEAEASHIKIEEKRK